MRSLARLLVLLIAAAAAVTVSAPAGACAAAAGDPCLQDVDTTHVSGHVHLDRLADGGPKAEFDGDAAGYVVWLDLDGNGTPDSGEPFDRTAADGSYTLEVDVRGVPATGPAPVLRVRVPDGARCTYPAPCAYTPPLEHGRDITGQDFGLALRAVLRGEIEDDKNADGKHQWGEYGIDNVVVYVDENANDKLDDDEQYASTDPYGRWEIGLPARLLGRDLHVRIRESRGLACKAPRTCEDIVSNVYAGETRDVGYWMVAQPLIVFVHGYLGSQMYCHHTEKLWVNLPRARISDLRIAPDGRSDLSAQDGGDSCTASVEPNGLVDAVAGADIYGGADRHYASLAKPDRYTALAWDWRKDPESQVAALDEAIDKLRCGGYTPCLSPRADKVTIVAHSQGGLLSRAYIADPARAKKVDRLVTIGTPTWGSPKAIFPLVAGIETPLGSPMDALLNNDDLKVAARNFAGGLALLPTDRYGRWLSVPQWRAGTLGQDGVADFVGAIGANELLTRAAMDEHRRIYDSYANGSLGGVDYRVVVGAGVPTITDIGLEYGYDERVSVRFGDGDQTVPLRSARFDAPEDRISTVCGVPHVPLTADPSTTNMIDRFVVRGDDPKPNPLGTDCPVDGTAVQVIDASGLVDGDGVFDFDLTPPQGLDPAIAAPAAATRSLRGAGTAAAGGAGAHVTRAARAQAAALDGIRVVAGGRTMTPVQAEAAGLADVLEFGGQRYIVSSARTPLRIEIPPSQGLSLVTQQITSAGTGPERRYGPVTGAATVTTGTAGVTAAVATGGRVLAPVTRADRTPPRTTARVRRAAVRGRVRIVLRVRDASRVTGTFLRVGARQQRVRPGRPLTLSLRDARRARIGSVDVWGNAERPHPLPLPPTPQKKG